MSAVGLDLSKRLALGSEPEPEWSVFQGPFQAGGQESRRSPWADSYTEGRHPWTSRGQAKPSRSSSSPSQRWEPWAPSPFCWCPAPGSIMLATCSLCASGLCQVLVPEGTCGRGKSRRLVEGGSPQATRHLGTLSASPVGQRPQDGRCPGEQAGLEGGGKEQAPDERACNLILCGGSLPFSPFFHIWGGGTHSWGLKGWESGYHVGAQTQHLPKREKPCSTPPYGLWLSCRMAAGLLGPVSQSGGLGPYWADLTQEGP